MRKVITFLGIYPKRTEYVYQGKVYAGQVFAEALYQFLDFDQMLVFVTDDARRNAFHVLESLQDERIIPVDIPIGEDAKDMWEIFEKLTAAVDNNDTVIFDITHGLRSIPFLVFLAAAFLKSAKQVTIEAIYYGAFELQKDSQGNPRPAPIIELSEFVSLIDWLNASEQFVNFGNASALAYQLRAARPRLQQADQSVRVQSKAIAKAAATLDGVSRSLRLILPDKAMEASDELQGVLGTAATAMKQWARPFTVLAQQVADSYAPLALPHPRAPENIVSCLNRERQLIQWYLDRQLLVQAAAVAREWIISWGLVHAGYTNLYEKNNREEIEKVLGQAMEQSKNRHGAFDDCVFTTGERLHHLPLIKKVLDLYRNLGEVRNTLLHAGKRPHVEPAETLEKRAVSLCQQLNELPLPDQSEVRS